MNVLSTHRLPLAVVIKGLCDSIRSRHLSDTKWFFMEWLLYTEDKKEEQRGWIMDGMYTILNEQMTIEDMLGFTHQDFVLSMNKTWTEWQKQGYPLASGPVLWVYIRVMLEAKMLRLSDHIRAHFDSSLIILPTIPEDGTISTTSLDDKGLVEKERLISKWIHSVSSKAPLDHIYKEYFRLYNRYSSSSSSTRFRSVLITRLTKEIRFDNKTSLHFAALMKLRYLSHPVPNCHAFLVHLIMTYREDASNSNRWIIDKYNHHLSRIQTKPEWEKEVLLHKASSCPMIRSYIKDDLLKEEDILIRMELFLIKQQDVKYLNREWLESYQDRFTEISTPYLTLFSYQTKEEKSKKKKKRKHTESILDQIKEQSNFLVPAAIDRLYGQSTKKSFIVHHEQGMKVQGPYSIHNATQYSMIEILYKRAQTYKATHVNTHALEFPYEQTNPDVLWVVMDDFSAPTFKTANKLTLKEWTHHPQTILDTLLLLVIQYIVEPAVQHNGLESIWVCTQDWSVWTETTSDIRIISTREETWMTCLFGPNLPPSLLMNYFEKAWHSTDFITEWEKHIDTFTTDPDNINQARLLFLYSSATNLAIE